MNRINYYIVVFITLLLISCNDDHPVDMSKKSSECTLTSQCVFKLPDGINDTNLVGIIGLSYYQTAVINSSSKVQSFSWGNSSARFCSSSIILSKIGDLFINSDTMKHVCISVDCIDCEGSEPSCSYQWDSKDMPFSEQIITWHGTGNDIFPAFELPLQAPKSYFTMSTPDLNQKVKRSEPLTIKWDGEHQPKKNLVKISIRGTIGNSYYTKYYYVEDNGIYSIPAEDINQYTSANLNIEIFVGRNTLFEVLPGKYICAEIYSSYGLTLGLTD